LPVEGGGVATRDFVYVDDICRGLIACATKGTPGDVYNLASGVETTIRELAEMINDLTGNGTPLEIKPVRDWDHSGRRFGSTLKSMEYLGFEAQTPLSDGLKRTIEWTRRNLSRIASSIEKHRDQMKHHAGNR